MSKMKHLLRKLHIGNNHTNHHHRRRVPNQRTTSPSSSASITVNDSTPPPSSTSTSTSTSSSASVSSPPSVDSVILTAGSTAVEDLSSNVDTIVNNSGGSGGGGGVMAVQGRGDYNYFEEEFQVQLAMAISASADREARTRDRDEDEADCQIKAAKQLSLACSPSVPDNDRLSDYLSLKYWNYNVVQYDEKVVDGFYDVYAIASNPVSQGAMPLLVDLQAISIFDTVDYEVLLVNRSVDTQLQQLENKVYSTSVECRVLGNGLHLNNLIQRLAAVVVDRMGGPVNDAGEMMKRWRLRSSQLRATLNSVVLPLGCLDVGLSRHRALLFKVLADRIHLPCMLVKGSLYTGTDEGAVNLVKFEDGSEYIIDLMGAPGVLIPSEVPSSVLLDTALEARAFSDCRAAVNNLSLVFDKVIGVEGLMPDIIRISDVYGSDFEEAKPLNTQASPKKEDNVVSELANTCEYSFEKHVSSEPSLYDCSPSVVEETSSAQEKKVKDVSKYVISAAKNPEFAQKLHAVLLESGASPPADLFVDMNPDILGRRALLGVVQPMGQKYLFSGGSYNAGDYKSNYDMPLLTQSTFLPQNNCSNKPDLLLENPRGQQLQFDSNCALPTRPSNDDVGVVTEATEMIINDTSVDSSSRLAGHDGYVLQGSGGRTFNQAEVEDSGLMFIESDPDKRACLPSCNGYNESLCPKSGENVCPMLGEFAEWEIPWEDLDVGERIGIGSYGEVYHADWNGTEVAVKKFLVQDLTGDVLVQFKCEAEMLIRLRHPNVVLFMGAVTRPPNLSILTEFLPRGSLYRLLHRSGIYINEKKRMKMALDVARGMNYLHTCHPTVVHRDLKSPNLLVDKNWGVKVCDFGLSRLKHNTFLSSNSTAGTPEWMAPEVLRNEPSNEKCDVYSFGVILWELATLCVPWTGLNPMQVVGAVGFQNRRLEIPEDVDPVVANIILDCWENDPRSRPSFSQLISSLKGLQHLVVQRN